MRRESFRRFLAEDTIDRRLSVRKDHHYSLPQTPERMARSLDTRRRNALSRKLLQELDRRARERRS